MKNGGSSQSLAVCLSLQGLCKQPLKRLKMSSRRCKIILGQSTPTRAQLHTQALPGKLLHQRLGFQHTWKKPSMIRKSSRMKAIYSNRNCSNFQITTYTTQHRQTYPCNKSSANLTLLAESQLLKVDEVGNKRYDASCHIQEAHISHECFVIQQREGQDTQTTILTLSSRSSDQQAPASLVAAAIAGPCYLLILSARGCHLWADLSGRSMSPSLLLQSHLTSEQLQHHAGRQFATHPC